MRGFLVVNHYLCTEKFKNLHSHLIGAAKKMGIQLEQRTNFEMPFETEKPDFVLFWDKDVALARSLENKGIAVFNSAESIAVCDDKAKTFLRLEHKFRQPKTIVAPLTYFGGDYTGFVNKAVEELGIPFVFKECCGSFGEQVFLCNSPEEALLHISRKPFLLQEFIECGGEDVRIEVVGDKVVAAMKRHNPSDFRSNITNGGTAAPYSPTKEENDLALGVAKELGLTFCGVDIMAGNVLCEVNSNAHIMNIMNTTGTDIAPYIFEEIIRRKNETDIGLFAGGSETK